MKSMRIKSIVFGFIIGALTASSVTAFGLVYASGKVEAWVQDKQIRILVDDKHVPLPDDMHILNYNNRIYTPARLVADSLGATVEWNESMQAVSIRSAEPEVIEIEVEVEREREADAVVDNRKYHYSELPIRINKENVRINITQVELYNSVTEVFVDFENASDYPVMFLKEQTYLEYDGVKYTIFDDYDGRFNNSTDSKFKKDDMRLTFEGIPKDATEVKLNLVMELYNRNYSTDPYPTIQFEFYMDITEEEYYNSR